MYSTGLSSVFSSRWRTGYRSPRRRASHLDVAFRSIGRGNGRVTSVRAPARRQYMFVLWDLLMRRQLYAQDADLVVLEFKLGRCLALL